MRRWTEDMDAYLEKSWGSISTKKLAQNLNVTEAAVKNKACKMGLGSMLSNKDFLIASHIKPWSKCKSNQKLDVNNGLLLCPNHDRLFDEGWISFDEIGKIIKD